MEIFSKGHKDVHKLYLFSLIHSYLYMTLCNWGSWLRGVCKTIVFASDTGTWGGGGQEGEDVCKAGKSENHLEPQSWAGAHADGLKPVTVLVAPDLDGVHKA